MVVFGGWAGQRRESVYLLAIASSVNKKYYNLTYEASMCIIMLLI